MDRRSFVRLWLLAPVGAGVTMAHDPSKHRGKPWKGEVVSVEKERFQLKTDDGLRTITITEKTTFERGNDHVKLGELKKGARVSVFGTILASGEEMVAREVLLDELPAHAPSAHEQGHTH